MSIKPLSDYCEVITKGTTPKTMGIDFVESGIPFIKIENINEGRIVIDSGVSYIDEAADKALSRSRIYSGDVLISIAGTIGKTVVVPLEIPRLNCNQAIAIIRPKKGLDSQYLKHWLASPAAIEQINGAKVTATIANLSLGQIGNLNIDLPPLEEQKRIAAILDKANSLRRKRAQAIALADDFLRATFLDLFGDPVTNPKGWPTTSMGEFCEFYAGNSLPDGDVFEGQSNGVLHLKVGDMNLPGNEEIVSVAREWSLNAKGAIIAPAGSILIPKRGGAIATNKKRLLSRACALDPNLMAISPKFPMHQEYLFIWFSLFDLTSISSGSAVPQLNKGDLAPLEIIIPPAGELERFMLIHSKIKDVLRRLQMASVDNTNICNALNHGCLH